jgi:predicted Rdx family selenoprotein
MRLSTQIFREVPNGDGKVTFDLGRKALTLKPMARWDGHLQVIRLDEQIGYSGDQVETDEVFRVDVDGCQVRERRTAAEEPCEKSLKPRSAESVNRK